MKAADKIRLRLLIETAILVRQGEVIDAAVADERARNLTLIIEGFIEDLKGDQSC